MRKNCLMSSTTTSSHLKDPINYSHFLFCLFPFFQENLFSQDTKAPKQCVCIQSPRNFRHFVQHSPPSYYLNDYNNTKTP